MNNQIIISSNLFMNDIATNNTMSKLSHISKNSSIVIINNAEPSYGITSVLGFNNYGFTNVQEITISNNNLEEQLLIIENADVVVFSGGNPWPLLESLRQTNALYHITNDAIIIGVSAGSMVLGKDIGFLDLLAPEYNEYNLFIDTEGYDLFNGNSIIPHCDEYFSTEQIDNVINRYGSNFILINQFDEIVN